MSPDTDSKFVKAVMREVYSEILGYQPHVIEAAIAAIAQMPRSMNPRLATWQNFCAKRRQICIRMPRSVLTECLFSCDEIMIEATPRVFRCLDIEVHEQEFNVRRAGVVVRAEPRVFQLLLFL